MAERVPKITDLASLELWLGDNPSEWAAAIAVRAALRVLPAVGELLDVDDALIGPPRRRELILRVFRTMFVSWAASHYRIADFERHGAAAVSPARRHDEDVAVAPVAATRAAVAAAARAVDAVVFASTDRRSTGGRAVDAAVFAAVHADDAFVRATGPADAVSAGATFWRSIEADVAWLTATPRDGNPAGRIASLMAQPLWLSDVRGDPKYRANFPPSMRALFDRMANNPAMKEAGFGHWIAWYRKILPNGPNRMPASHFGEVLDIKLATQPDEWWNRDPRKVNEEIAGWYDTSHMQRPTIRQFVSDYLKGEAEPRTLGQILDAFEAASYAVIPKSVRGQLSYLASEGAILRVSRGLYAWNNSNDGGSDDRHTGLPKPIANVPSPFSYAFSSSGTISVVGGGLNRLSVPGDRSPRDATNRLDAARQLATDLADEVSGGAYQVRTTYVSSLRRYAARLPRDHDGNIYLADAEARTLRTDFVADVADHLDVRFAARLKTLLEAHQGLRVYFPDLMAFYEDVRQGALAESLPLDAFDRLDKVIAEFTPVVFDPSVGASLADIEQKAGPEQVARQIADGGDTLAIQPPPDPIAEIDPVRAAQHAKGGAINRIWALLLKGEAGAKNIDRIEKPVSAYGKYVGPVLQWLAKLTSGGS